MVESEKKEGKIILTKEE